MRASVVSADAALVRMSSSPSVFRVPAENGVASLLEYRNRFPGDRGLIHAGGAGRHVAIHRDLLARAHAHERPDGDMIDRHAMLVQGRLVCVAVMRAAATNLQLHTAAMQYTRFLGCLLYERTDGVARAVHAPDFEQIRQ